MSSDGGAFGSDGVAQAGHELHIPLAEPGVCGLAVDEQLKASGTVRVALQADFSMRDVEAANTPGHKVRPRRRVVSGR